MTAEAVAQRLAALPAPGRRRSPLSPAEAAASDLPRGDHETLIRSIREQLWPLGDDVTFVPGHGDLSTFGNERMSNPYCSDFVEV